jgi:hypothetical protein
LFREQHATRLGDGDWGRAEMAIEQASQLPGADAEAFG